MRRGVLDAPLPGTGVTKPERFVWTHGTISLRCNALASGRKRLA